MSEKTVQSIFIQGPIPIDLITSVTGQYNLKKLTGAYNIFLGQVRSDETGGSRVKAIEYSAHTTIAMEKYLEIQASLFRKYPINGLHAYHSLGTVHTGEICFFVLTASVHRKEAIRACQEAVDRIKAELAIWGKLLLENGTVLWKENI